ncbi:stage II sporulation protein M [Bacillus sp. NPDC093026]|uniref:stage II sporulation protein M n=1 Tax=Bacillus sp. NPDC093026 TaxID=3363948 RepID=UPI003806A27C
MDLLFPIKRKFTKIIYILTALIPHGIFEIPAMILSGSLGFKLLDFVYLKIREMYSPKKHFFSDILFFTMMICLLTLLAALTEALLTPFLLNKLQ